MSCEVEVMVTKGGLRRTLGAMYKSPIIVPHAVPEQPFPVTFQVVPFSTTTHSREFPASTSQPVPGEMLTLDCKSVLSGLDCKSVLSGL